MNSHLPSSEPVIRPASFADIPFIQQIASETWPVAYSSIISQAQLQYMLGKIYSAIALETQMKEHHYFFLLLINYKPVGFAAFSQVQGTIYKLQKLYVLPCTQKNGLGQALLNTVETHARQMGGATLQLNVNRHNNAKAFYLKNGFSVIKEEDIDIGEGYFMNDYLMEKTL